MQSVKDDAVGGFNGFIEEQKKVGDANLTVVWFDDGFTVGYEGRLSEVPSIGSWPSGGMTALRDAIGKTFKHVAPRFSEEKPEKVVMAILTDGFENSSREFTKETVASLIKEHQDKYGWSVIFLAADQDAWATAQTLNICRDATVNFSTQDVGAGFRSYSSAVTRARS
jgi:hypothetical protein